MGKGKNKNPRIDYDRQNRDREQRQDSDLSERFPVDDNPREKLRSSEESDTEILAKLLETLDNVGKIKSDAYNSFNTASQILTWTKKDAPSLLNVIGRSIRTLESALKDQKDQLEREFSYSRQQISNILQQEISTRLSSQSSRLNGAIGNIQTALTDNVAKISGKQKQKFDEIAMRFDTLDGRLKEISESTDVIHSLRGDIADINQLLSESKIEREFPAANQDEETIRQLAECGAEILNRLAIAARWYARKKPDLEHMSDFENNLRAELEKEKAAAFQRGQEAGRRQFVKDLLVKFGDVHEIFTNENLRVLATALKNEGVECASEYNVGDIIKITRENIDRISGLRPTKPGKIRITSPAYFFDSKIIRDATFEDFVEPATEIPAEPVLTITDEPAPVEPEKNKQEEISGEADDHGILRGH